MTDGLDYLKHVPDGASSATPVLVVLHGRGADANDMLGLRRGLPDDWAVIAVQAPFPAAPWGYGPGYAWYRYLGEDVPEEHSFAESLNRLHAFLGDLPSVLGFEPDRLAVGGFSQGGTLSLAHALAYGDTRPVLNFSGFLARHPGVDGASPDGVRVFWGHGTQDGNIPFAMAVSGRAELERRGVAVEARDYGIGHWIDGHELADAVTWVEGVWGEG